MKKYTFIIGFIFVSLFSSACRSEIHSDEIQSEQIVQEQSLDGMDKDGSVPYVDDMVHTDEHDVENEVWPANYIECMGGYTEDFYWCWDCQKAVDENGKPVEYIERTE